MPNIPIMRAKLPVADRIVGYLRGIDASRFYSNFRAALPVTEALAESTLAVPFYRDLDRSEAGRVAEPMLAVA